MSFRGAETKSERDAETTLEAKKAVNQVKSLAVVQIALGAIGLASPLLVLARQSNAGTRLALEKLHELMWSGDVGFYMKSAMASSFVLSVFLVFVGLASNKLRPIARPLTFAHAFLSLANAIFNLVVVFGMLVPALLDFSNSAGPTCIGAAIGGIIGGAMGGFFGLLFPILELWTITRPGVRELLSSP